MIAITTVGFGAPEVVRVAPSDLYTFPDALPGLEESHRYALVSRLDAAPFHWLQSLDEALVCLPVLRLEAMEVGDYASAVAAVVGEDEEAVRARVLIVARFDQVQGTFLVNLLAPIILDMPQGTGKQIILDGRGYALRQSVQWDAAAHRFRLPC
jgi:flagellar assembly factor FliW